MLRNFISWVTEQRWAMAVSTVIAALNALVAFNVVALEGHQIGTIDALLIPVGGFLIQAKVWSKSTHDAEVAAARASIEVPDGEPLN